MCAVFGALWAVSATTQAQVVQTNNSFNTRSAFSISSTAINAGMLSSFDANIHKVSPALIGEVTLPGSPSNGIFLGGSNGPGVNDPVIIQGGGNHGNSAVVPEPSTWAMILLGAGVLVASMRFRQRRA